MDYYMSLPREGRDRHVNTGEFKLLAIYVHVVALNDHTTTSGYDAKKGEVLSIDEYFIYDFNNKCWNDDPKFMTK